MPQIVADAAARPVAEDAIRGPVVARVKLAAALGDGFQLTGTLRVLAAEASVQGRADVGRDVEARAERAVAQIADERFLLLVAEAGHVDQCARVGGDDHADPARQAQAQGEVILRGRVLDAAGTGRHAVEEADDPLLRLHRQPGQAAARDAGRGVELLRVAGQL